MIRSMYSGSVDSFVNFLRHNPTTQFSSMDLSLDSLSHRSGTGRLHGCKCGNGALRVADNPDRIRLGSSRKTELDGSELLPAGPLPSIGRPLAMLKDLTGRNRCVS